MPRGIAVVGANGSGKTTLGAALAKRLGYKRMDVEDYYFESSEIPYEKPRTHSEVQALLLEDMERFGSFVLSAVCCDFGDAINSLYDCVVYVEVPPEIRLERVKRRSADQFGDRILPGGDLYEREQAFFNFVATRSMERTEAWVKSMKCPVLRVDGTGRPEEIAAEALKQIRQNTNIQEAQYESD